MHSLAETMRAPSSPSPVESSRAAAIREQCRTVAHSSCHERQFSSLSGLGPQPPPPLYEALLALLISRTRLARSLFSRSPLCSTCAAYLWTKVKRAISRIDTLLCVGNTITKSTRCSISPSRATRYLSSAAGLAIHLAARTSPARHRTQLCSSAHCASRLHGARLILLRSFKWQVKTSPRQERRNSCRS